MSSKSFTETRVQYQTFDGVDVFYRAAGSPESPVLLLLHGFPSSSFQYRNLISRLSIKYRVIAPDLPGFGFTKVPKSGTDGEESTFKYTFENISKVIVNFTHALGLEKFGLYVFDYGAPIGFRLAMERPHAITSIITQNGNTFVEGLGDFWDLIRPYWKDPTSANREAIRFLTTFDLTKSQYTTGEAHPDAVPPETYYLDQLLMDREGNADIQLDLFYDYRSNVALYPKIHEYLRTYRPPILAVWGKNDIIFTPPGAEAFKKLLPESEVHLVDGGHFILENHLEEVSSVIEDFLDRRVSTG